MKHFAWCAAPPAAAARYCFCSSAVFVGPTAAAAPLALRILDSPSISPLIEKPHTDDEQIAPPNYVASLCTSTHVEFRNRTTTLIAD